MEFEGLSEEVQWELKRVGAAFGIREWIVDDGPNQVNGVSYEGAVVSCGVDLNTARFIGVQVKGPNNATSIIYDEGWIHSSPQSFWNCEFHPVTSSLMFRGLYRMGFDESVLNQLPALTAHEKLELRLSMPREFWPRKWLEEEHENY